MEQIINVPILGKRRAVRMVQLEDGSWVASVRTLVNRRAVNMTEHGATKQEAMNRIISKASGHHFQAQIRLANGQIAGEGYGASKKTAMYFACLDAIHNGYPQAATGHASYLSIKRMDQPTTLVRQGTLRGAKYEIYSYPAGRSLSGPILGYLVKVQHGDGSWVTERARTLRGAETKLDKTSQWNWRYENEFQKRYGVPAENPFVMDTKEKVGVALGVAAGLTALIYYVMKKPAATTTTTSTSATPTLQLQPGGAQSITLGPAGYTLTLPAGGVWGAGVTGAGTNTPLVIPAPPAGTSGQSETVPIAWVLNGTQTSTTVTMTA